MTPLHRIAVAATLLVFINTGASAQSPAGRFEKEIAAFEAADRAKPPQPGGIVFTGASGISMWKTLAEDFAELPVINRGFGGSYSADLIKYADRILIPLKPRVIALQPGSNDLVNGKTPEQVLTDFDAFVKKVRATLPEVKIVYLGINPSPKRWDIRDAQQRTNQLIEAHCKAGQNLAFVDLWTSSIGPDGQGGLRPFQAGARNGRTAHRSLGEHRRRRGRSGRWLERERAEAWREVADAKRGIEGTETLGVLRPGKAT